MMASRKKVGEQKANLQVSVPVVWTFESSVRLGRDKGYTPHSSLPGVPREIQDLRIKRLMLFFITGNNLMVFCMGFITL
jgi:hypothetical protein